MAEFDREDLKAAFEVGKIPVADDNIMRLDGLLRSARAAIPSSEGRTRARLEWEVDEIRRDQEFPRRPLGHRGTLMRFRGRDAPDY